MGSNGGRGEGKAWQVGWGISFVSLFMVLGRNKTKHSGGSPGLGLAAMQWMLRCMQNDREKQILLCCVFGLSCSETCQGD